jgi:3-carboxy-cis,cis-muconate cycloisomerase
VLPWHTDRLRIIDLATGLARVTAALGKIARDVTLLAQSEVGEVSEGKGGGSGAGTPLAASPRRGGSSAMPHKHNPVAAIAILGCTKQAPGLLATLVACAEQEHQRAAGAWHAEWEPLTALLRLTGSAAQAHDLVAEAARRAVSAGLPLRDVLLAVPKLEGQLASAGITAEQIESALEPAGYLGATDEFVTAALRAHAALDGGQPQEDGHG